MYFVTNSFVHLLCTLSMDVFC